MISILEYVDKIKKHQLISYLDDKIKEKELVGGSVFTEENHYKTIISKGKQYKTFRIGSFHVVS